MVESNDPEARRCRLWGDFWIEHRIPAILAWGELEELSNRIPSDIETRLRAAAKAVVQAVVAGSRMNEIEGLEEGWTAEEIDEYDQLMERWERLTVLLADYARVITDSLPALRRANSETTSPRGDGLPSGEQQAVE